MYVDYEDDEAELLLISYTPERLRQSERNNVRYNKYKESFIERARIWAKNNPDKLKASRQRCKAKYIARNRDTINQRRRERFANDAEFREKVREANRRRKELYNIRRNENQCRNTMFGL